MIKRSACFDRNSGWVVSETSYMNEFDDPFWTEDDIDLEQFEGAYAVARLSQSNAHVAHNKEKFEASANAIIGGLVAIFREQKAQK